MSTAHPHPTTVQQPVRTVPPAVLALIAVAAFAIVAFAIGQAGVSIGGPAAVPASDAAAASQTEAYRQQRLGEMTTGERIVVRDPTDSRLRRSAPPVLTPEQRAQRLGEYWEAKDSVAGTRGAASQVELHRALAYQAWAEYIANLQNAQKPFLHEEGTQGFRGGR